MLIRFKMVSLGTSIVKHQWLLNEAVKQLISSNITSPKGPLNELPDRGRDKETKTVADPHSKPVQE
jgi:hypothetical protein